MPCSFISALTSLHMATIGLSAAQNGCNSLSVMCLFNNWPWSDFVLSTTQLNSTEEQLRVSQLLKFLKEKEGEELIWIQFTANFQIILSIENYFGKREVCSFHLLSTRIVYHTIIRQLESKWAIILPKFKLTLLASEQQLFPSVCVCICVLCCVCWIKVWYKELYARNCQNICDLNASLTSSPT